MWVSWHCQLEMVLGLVGQRSPQAGDPIDRVVRVRPHEHRNVGGDLVVARACGAPAGPPPGPTISVNPPLDRHVDVLVAVRERERAVERLCAHLLQTALDVIALRRWR